MRSISEKLFYAGVLGVIFLPAIFFYADTGFQIGTQVASYVTTSVLSPIFWLIFLVTLPSLVVVIAINFRFSRRCYQIEKTQDWLIDSTNAHIKKLEYHNGLINKLRLSDLDESAPPPKNNEPSRGKAWPWGRHETESLRHLEAAAKRFWTLYEPGDPSTAPTNEMVSDWLQDERKVSKDKAKAIASILRADGLPTGPRR